MTFEYNALTGYGLDTFLEVLDWGRDSLSPADLRWHIERAIQNKQARNPGLKRFLNNFDGERLWC